MKLKHEQIQYIEFLSQDFGPVKEFYSKAFGWDFTDYGPEYTAFSNQGIDGGFYSADKASSAEAGGALVILYSDSLEEVQARVERARGVILKPIFSFPGGRRFHFTEPSGNELAVWSDVDP